jgi:hypothetical protein
VDEVGEWIIQERETREKLKKEKAEVRLEFCSNIFSQVNIISIYSARLRKREKLRRLPRKRYVSPFLDSLCFTLFFTNVCFFCRKRRRKLKR